VTGGPIITLLVAVVVSNNLAAQALSTPRSVFTRYSSQALPVIPPSLSNINSFLYFCPLNDPFFLVHNSLHSDQFVKVEYTHTHTK
jgi:hypothetical protein